MKRRLYVVVRGDLPPGLQMAQACHVTRLFSLTYPKLQVGENLIVLRARDEGELLRLWCDSGACEGVTFKEPDLGNQYTAIALESSAQKLLSSLPLALRQT